MNRTLPAARPFSRLFWLLPLLVALVPGAVLVAETLGLDWPRALVSGSVLLSAGILAWRLLLVARYRPEPGAADDELPTVTVVVPAYNEGAQVFKTLKSLVESDYPAEKLHVVAVDDGSADDTWLWIAKARAVLGDRVTAVRCRMNRGKRAALLEGFDRARGDVLVTVDSDSEVLPDTLRNLVTPLRDPRVGAVAGHVRVLNDGIIPRMMDVAFTFAFELLRASESRVNTVSCCPGALSAWRRSTVEAVKEEWASQSFLGEPSTIGEDRAMTNLVLRSGLLVRYQSNAVVLTEVPETLPKLSRMLLRWARSDVRETLVLLRFVFTRFRPESALGARVNVLWASSRTLLRGLTFAPMVALLSVRPELLPGVLAALLLWAVVPFAVFSVLRGGTRALWAFPWALVSFFCLSWIGPWALVTPHRSAWLTRTLPARPAALEVEAG